VSAFIPPQGAAFIRLSRKEKSRFLNKEYLHRTHRFCEKYGGKTIILARFIPIIRTFALFVAGIGSMAYRRCIIFNVLGGIAWVVIFALGGYFLVISLLSKAIFRWSSLQLFFFPFCLVLPNSFAIEMDPNNATRTLQA
jgi:membrane protein DedA with SNARE-associated domain